jgi:DNA replication and repair protein RecF
MFVRFLRLRSFRNYAEQEVRFEPGLAAFTGDNGQGKTNLLEAMCVLATTKSPLVERERELMRWDSTSTRLEAEVVLSTPREHSRRLLFEWTLQNNSLSRQLQVGGVPQSALSQWLGLLQVVAFFPHDLTVVAGEPGERRRFLNLELGKARPSHFADASRYKRALAQRNALLKYFLEHPRARRAARAARQASTSTNEDGEEITLPNAGLGTLGEWNRAVVGHGARVWEQRAAFARELGPLLREVHRELSGLDAPLSVEFVPGLPPALRPDAEDEGADWERLFSLALEDEHEIDARRGTTGNGPQRDDLIFRLGDMDLRRFGSQGQQRLAVLALKIALAQWVREATGESPILLLDDALSELDATRRERVLRLAAGFEQAIITATDDTFLGRVPARILAIQAGRIANPEEAAAAPGTSA